MAERQEYQGRPSVDSRNTPEGFRQWLGGHKLHLVGGVVLSIAALLGVREGQAEAETVPLVTGCQIKSFDVYLPGTSLRKITDQIKGGGANPRLWFLEPGRVDFKLFDPNSYERSDKRELGPQDEAGFVCVDAATVWERGPVDIELTPTQTQRPEPTATKTSSPSPTRTPVPPTATVTRTLEPTATRTLTPSPTLTPTPTETPITEAPREIRLEAEGFQYIPHDCPGDFRPRSNASNLGTMWLQGGRNEAYCNMDFNLRFPATYALELRYSSDGGCCTANVIVDGVLLAQVDIVDTRKPGMLPGEGWNNFEKSGALGDVFLDTGDHIVRVEADPGSFEIDVVILSRVD